MPDNRTVPLDYSKCSSIPDRRKNGRELAVWWRRQAGAVRFFVLIAPTMLLFLAVGTPQASMYVCRSKSGAINFTNAPVSPDCQSVSLPKTGRMMGLAGEIAAAYSRPSRSAMSAGYEQEIRSIARRYKMDPHLIKAIIHTESDFNHRAVSRSGAQGLMQLMPETARDLRVANPFDPWENIDGGTRYMRWLLDSFSGDLILSLAAYNAGPGLVSRTGGVPRIQETRRYVNKVLKRYKAYKTQHDKATLLVQE